MNEEFPSRYQIDTGDCTLTDFRKGNRWVKTAILSVWLIAAGAILFIPAVAVGLDSLPAMIIVGILGAGYGLFFGVILVHTAYQFIIGFTGNAGAEGDRE